MMCAPWDARLQIRQPFRGGAITGLDDAARYRRLGSGCRDRRLAESLHGAAGVAFLSIGPKAWKLAESGPR